MSSIQEEQIVAGMRKDGFSENDITKFLNQAQVNRDVAKDMYDRMTGAAPAIPQVGQRGQVQAGSVMNQASASSSLSPKPTYTLGATSLRNLVGVHPILINCTKRAIQLTQQDFGTYDGVRTLEEQRTMVKRGTSKTMFSKHLPQQGDDLSHALDNVPWVNGAYKWDWEGCFLVAMAMDQAATEQGVAHLITWGAVWDKRLADFGGDRDAYVLAVNEYKSRHNGPDFLDGPHFELTF